jgi:hypothetical protein
MPEEGAGTMQRQRRGKMQKRRPAQKAAPPEEQVHCYGSQASKT